MGDLNFISLYWHNNFKMCFPNKDVIKKEKAFFKMRENLAFNSKKLCSIISLKKYNCRKALKKKKYGQNIK